MKIDITKPAPTLAEINAEKQNLQVGLDRLARKKIMTWVGTVAICAVWFLACGYFIRNNYDSSVFLIRVLVLLLEGLLIFVGMYFFYLSHHGQKEEIELGLFRLQEAAPSDHQKISANMACPEIAAYCRAVASQGRKLTFLEANALDRWIDEANAQAEIKELYEHVYGPGLK